MLGSCPAIVKHLGWRRFHCNKTVREAEGNLDEWRYTAKPRRKIFDKSRMESRAKARDFEKFARSRVCFVEHVKEHSHAEAGKRINKRREQRCRRNQAP